VIESCDLIIRQPGHPERVVRLQDGVTRLGRAEDNDVVLSDVGVSRRHARLVVSRDAVRVEDLGSGNGTYYRGFRVQSQQVDDADELVIDPFVLQFRIRGSSKKIAHATTEPVPTAPTPGTGARLDVVAGAGLAKTSYPISARGLTIGRSETRDVVIPDPAASRHHCSILQRDNTWILRDMGSANGVYVNGNRVRESLLADGDRIRIGNTEMRFVIGDATQADSTTQRVRPEPWGGDGWTANELSLPQPEAATPRAHARQGSSVGRVVIGGLGLLAVFVIIFVMAFVVFLGSYLIYANMMSHPTTLAGAPTPPAWHLDLPGGLPNSDVKTLQDQGIQALKSGDNKAALESFYRVLRAEPGKASAERLAFAAGEYLVLHALEEQLRTSADARRAREARRTALLDDVHRGGARRRNAIDELIKDFRDDPVVNSDLDWTASAAALQAQRDMTDAAELCNDDKWSDAATKYGAVIATTLDPSTRKSARAGFKLARRELAREVSAEWRAGVLAQKAGDTGVARVHLQKVLAIDPNNPSARVRLAMLGPSDGAVPKPQ
jgi:pSer/pThr/pTyr-binding forkhead associated (FHA) protein